MEIFHHFNHEFELKVGLLSERERALLEDLFIAYIAIANNKPLITCDTDFKAFEENGLKVIFISEAQ